jgi:hypothetical protein
MQKSNGDLGGSTCAPPQGADVDSLKRREPFAFAVLCDCWRDPAGDAANPQPNAGDLRQGDGRQWLEESFGDQPMILAAVLRPWPSELMEAHEVSTLVNSPENDTAACIQPVLPSQPSQPVKRQLPLL